MNKHKQSGFTIVELLIVVVVIAILAAITIVAYNGIQNRAKDSAALSNAQQVGKKITAHALLNSETLPATLADVGITNSGDLTYQYSRNTTVTPNLFCLTATSGGISAHIAGSTNFVKNAVAGPCTGHTGTAPTVAADGNPCPTNYIVVPGNSLFDTEAFCIMKYEAVNVNSIPTGQASGTPWVTVSQTAAINLATTSCAGCHLVTEAEWLTVAHNILSVPSNWSGGSIDSGYIYSGHNDNSPSSPLTASTDDSDGYSGTGQTSGNQRRTLTLTNGEVIWDLAGNVSEWVDATIAGGQHPGIASEPALTWKQWNTANLIFNGLPISSRPSYGTSTAIDWTSGDGLGQLASNYTETTLMGFYRGGYWANTYNAGIFALALASAPSGTNAIIGFRVAR